MFINNFNKKQNKKLFHLDFRPKEEYFRKMLFKNTFVHKQL